MLGGDVRRADGLVRPDEGHTDLDHLAGTWQQDPDFDRAVAEFERIDDESRR